MTPLMVTLTFIKGTWHEGAKISQSHELIKLDVHTSNSVYIVTLVLEALFLPARGAELLLP
ncbi:hypothetical protein [Corynebacterium halotolerans]|uniref:hypothetical protein n=1 Tax=Corynebacterium halotolerans TaxID=225326 RepID=UPI003CE9E684